MPLHQPSQLPISGRKCWSSEEQKPEGHGSVHLCNAARLARQGRRPQRGDKVGLRPEYRYGDLLSLALCIDGFSNELHSFPPPPAGSELLGD